MAAKSKGKRVGKSARGKVARGRPARAAAKSRTASRNVKKKTSGKARKVPYLPKGSHTVNVNICVKDAAKALEWYKNALGAKVGMVMPGPNGRGVMHAEFTIGGTKVMIGDEFPGFPNRSPETLGASTASFYVYVPNCDAAFERAVKAGGQVVGPLTTMFWGDRMAGIKDPFGHMWTLATHVETVSPAKIRTRHAAFAKEMAARSGMGG